MTDKAYIVANNKQELDVLNKFEEKGLLWRVGRNATDFVPSEDGIFNKIASFPYVLIEKNFIIWSPIEKLEDETIVYDGRKEDEEVDTRYKVTQKFMEELNRWRDAEHIKPTSAKVNSYVSQTNLIDLPAIVENWWVWGSKNPMENNNRLIAIIQWLNGEDVFEVDKPHKFVVRSDKFDHDGDYTYVLVENNMTTTAYTVPSATKFDTREEAQEWANSHQVVVEVDADGNEVEL